MTDPTNDEQVRRKLDDVALLTAGKLRFDDLDESERQVATERLAAARLRAGGSGMSARSARRTPRGRNRRRRMLPRGQRHDLGVRKERRRRSALRTEDR